MNFRELDNLLLKMDGFVRPNSSLGEDDLAIRVSKLSGSNDRALVELMLSAKRDLNTVLKEAEMEPGGHLEKIRKRLGARDVYKRKERKICDREGISVGRKLRKKLRRQEKRRKDKERRERENNV